jgi:hypothetical protein
MTPEPDAISRLHVEGDVVIHVDQAPPSRPDAGTVGVDVSGAVSDARTATGIPSLTVVALVGTSSESSAVVGRSVTDARGEFRIRFDTADDTRQRLLAWGQLPGVGMRLRVEAEGGTVLLEGEPVRPIGGSARVALSVDVPRRRVPRTAWRELGRSLAVSGTARLSDVVRSLSGVTPQERISMLDDLEGAFLDPTGIVKQTLHEVPTLQQLHDPDFVAALDGRLHEQGVRAQNGELDVAVLDMLAKAASFVDLSEVDWTIDPGLLSRGDLGAAIDKYVGQYSPGAFTVVVRDDLGLYRDYLRAIWTTNAAKVVYVAPHQLTEAQALDQLTSRFHQNFLTNDDAPVPVAEAQIPIVTDILTAPTGKGFGFGLASASLPAQGAESAQAYLAALIALSGLTATEFGLRYRLDVNRPASALSSPMLENILTLQGFFRDGFESGPETEHVDPDVHNQPIIPDKLQGDAPYFLYFDEWQRQQQPFYPENHFDVRQALPVDITDQTRIQLANLAGGKIAAQTSNVKLWTFCQDVLAIWDALVAGHAHFYAGEYGLALVSYRSAQSLAESAMADNVLQGWAMGPIYSARKAFPLKSMKDVPHFLDPYELSPGSFEYGDDPSDWEVGHMGLRLAYYALVTIPICLGDTEFAVGDYEHAVFHYGQATRFEVGIARETDSAGYRPWYLDDFEMYWRGDKPYTVRLNGPSAPNDSRYPLEEDDRSYDEYYDTTTENVGEQYAVAWSKRITHLAEQRYGRLRQASAMLEWADTLYRMDEPTSMARARELYKGVLFLHGQVPPIEPDWPRQGPLVGLPKMYLHHDENPALTSEKTRALRGVYQIDHGLNYYGESDDVVPILRYRPLKDTADRTAAMARGAQQDFLQYTQQVEAAMTARLQLSNFLQKAKLQSSIADEQTAIAQHDVVVAQDQVAAVQAAIKAKQDEIAQHDSLFGQIGDAIAGVTSLAKGIPGDTTSAVGAGVTSEATGDAMVGDGILGLGAGASVMTGIGIFAVVGYITLSGMSDADNKRSADLKTLADKALPAAQAVVTARQHAVTIASYQKQIAQADVDLAQTLLAFEQNRSLNQNFWLQLSQVARRTLRRYLELGARQAWLAERALAYEQDRALNIVRMDYFPAQLQGVTGADLMRADLAELDATRIEGMKRTVPVRRTISLAREFPLQYALLRSTGRCSFRTEEAFFKRAYPGTSAYRIRAVSGTVQQRELVQPMRGSLVNRGVSISKPLQPGEHLLIRPAESLPLSEFRLETDLGVYGLPNESLLTFEGSDIETFWELAFPRAANPAGLDSLVDVVLTFDLFCEFSSDQYEADLAAQPTSERKWILISGARYQKAQVASLAGAASTVDVLFDLPRLGLLPPGETGRKIKNAAIVVVAKHPLNVAVKLKTTSPASTIAVPITQGLALSTLPPAPVTPPLPASPLNALENRDPNQAFTVSIAKAANAGVDFTGVADIVLALEYEANLT